MGTPGRKKLKLGLLGLFLAVPLLCLPLVSFRTHARPGSLPPIIEFSRAPEQWDCLKALLNHADSYDFLEGGLQFSSIWRISTTTEAAGNRHAFYFAGTRPKTTRLFSTSFNIARGPSGDYAISAAEQGFGEQELQSTPAIADGAGLAVLRAAFNDAAVKIALLSLFTQEREDVQTVCVEKMPGNASDSRLVFASPQVGGASEVVLEFSVTFDPSAGVYRFRKD